MAKDEKDLEGDEVKTGGRKKLLLIIVAVVLLLVIAGGAAFFLMGSDAAPTDQAAAAEQGEPAEEAAPLPDPLYYQFKPQFVVSLPPGGRARMLQVSLEVMSRQQEAIDWLDRNSPMLRHYLFNLFSSQDPATLYSRDGREALDRAVLDRVRGLMTDNGFEGDIEAVYFNEFVLQ